MSIVIAVALAPATTVPGPAPSGASPEELVTIPAPAVDGRMPPQSLGYLEFDWADGGVPGFARLSDNSNQYASKQRENAQP